MSDNKGKRIKQVSDKTVFTVYIFKTNGKSFVKGEQKPVFNH